MINVLEETRKSIEKGEDLRASYLLEDLKKIQGLKEVPKKHSYLPWAKLYSPKDFHEAEKIYTSRLIQDMMERAVQQQDFNSYNQLHEANSIAQQNSLTYEKSVDFSRKIYNISENAKFMPLQRALNNNAIFGLYKDKENSQGGLLDIPISFSKGFVSGSVLNLADMLNKSSALMLYGAGKLVGSDVLKQQGEMMSSINVNFLRDEEKNNISFLAGELASFFAPIFASASIGAKTQVAASVFSDVFMKQFAKQFAASGLKAATVLGVGSLAGKIMESLGESFGWKNVSTQGLKAMTELSTMAYLHNYFITENLNQPKDFSQDYNAIINEAQDSIKSFFTENKENLKSFLTRTLGEIMPEQQNTQPKSTQIPEIYPVDTKSGLPAFKSQNNNIVTVQNLNSYSTTPNASGLGNTKNSLAVDYKPFVEASLENSIVKNVYFNNDLIPQDVLKEASALSSEIKPIENFSTLELGAISRESENINIVTFLDDDAAAEISLLRNALQRQGVDFSSSDARIRQAVLEEFLSQLGLDNVLTQRFMGSLQNTALPTQLSMEERGDLAVSVKKLSDLILNDAKAFIYLKYNPIIEKFDNMPEHQEYINSTREKLSQKFETLLADEKLRNAFEKIAEYGGKETSLYFDVNEETGDLVITGAFQSAILNLLNGEVNGEPISFYQGLKQARALLSRNNPYGYRASIPKVGFTDPKLSGFSYIRRNLIDPMYEAMRFNLESVLDASEIEEYAAGEKGFAFLKDEEQKVIENILAYDFRKKGQNPERLYQMFEKQPQALRYLQRIAYNSKAKNKYADGLSNYVFSLNDSILPEWTKLYTNGLVDKNADPFSALRTALILDSLSGTLRAQSRYPNEQFATWKFNRNAPLDLRNTKLNELLDGNQKAAFNRIAEHDLRHKLIRERGEKMQFEWMKETDYKDVFFPKHKNFEKTAMNLFKLLLKKIPIVNKFRLAIVAFQKDITKKTRKERLEALTTELAKIVKGEDILIKNALLERVKELK